MWFFSEEHHLLQEGIRHFSKKELAPWTKQLDETETFRPEVFIQLGTLGILGLTLPISEGGAGLDAVAATLAMEEIAAVDPSIALSFLAHTILCVHPISQNGSEEQKKKYLPLLLKGHWIGGLGMSEPQAGSDALGMQLRANYQEGGYVLQGCKTWITNGPIGDVFYCYARTGNDRKHISSFLIDLSISGFSRGKQISKMGMRGSPTGELLFENAWVPLSHRVGEEGKSIQLMMNNLDLERITISGISLGIARTCIEIATRYAKERYAFGKPIGAFQQIQERLAEATAHYQACRCFTYTVAKQWDLGTTPSRFLSSQSAQTKLQTAQMATKVALDAIQILGGAGYSRDFPVERYLRDAKLIEIGAGTNEILRLIIARQLLGKEVADAGH